jgi:hypothetical protein
MKIIATKAPRHQGFIRNKTLCATLCLCVLVATLTAGKDKINIICSPLGGYSTLPETEFQISYINPDGSVNWQKLNQMLWEISFTGANMWREFPPWILDEHQYEILTLCLAYMNFACHLFFKSLEEYIEYYHQDRTHYHLDKDPPVSRPVQTKESDDDKVIALPRVGGLHHKYVWKQAA